MKKSILFLCTGNSCRSQMAEGWGRFLQSYNYQCFSAGIESHGKNPKAIQVMAEVGVDISKQESQTVAQLPVTHFDYVITVCGHADEHCPYFPAKTKVIHVGFDDPPKLAAEFSEEDDILNCYRKVRDEIKVFISNLDQCLGENKEGNKFL